MDTGLPFPLVPWFNVTSEMTDGTMSFRTTVECLALPCTAWAWWDSNPQNLLVLGQAPLPSLTTSPWVMLSHDGGSRTHTPLEGHKHLGLACLPVPSHRVGRPTPKGRTMRSRRTSRTSGIRTHSITGSEPMWSTVAYPRLHRSTPAILEPPSFRLHMAVCTQYAEVTK